MASKPRHFSAGPRDVGLWALLGILIVVQLAALWLVCLSQVRQAQARHENLVVEQRAVEECVRRNSKSSLISCADQATNQQSPAASAGKRSGLAAAAR